MKKRCVLGVIAVFLLGLLTACKSLNGTYLHGLEHYNQSSIWIAPVLPSSHFLDDYDYLQGDYYYVTEDIISISKPAQEKQLLTLSYSEDIYISAKQEVFNTIKFEMDYELVYNGYTILICSTEVANAGYRIPYCFAMVGYNDNKNTLLFMSFYIDDSLLSDKEKEILAALDSQAYFNEYFSFYDFA